MKIEIIVRLEPELQALLKKFIEAMWDLAEVVAPLTGHKVRRGEP